LCNCLGTGYLNDLWRYDLNTNEWVWISGSKEVGQGAVYEQKGVPHPNNIPGSRFGGCMWEDNNGALWIFGGAGFSPDGQTGILISLFTNFP
jgi:hypothetical protein